MQTSPKETMLPAASAHPAPVTQPGHGRRCYLIACVALTAVAAGLLWFWSAHKGKPRRATAPSVAVLATTARQENVPVYLDAIGTVTPIQTALITSQVNGQVTAVHYDEGTLVHRGDALIDIDPRPFAATLLQAQGVLERDTELLAQAKMDLERYRAAWSKNAIAKQQLDDQEKLVAQTEGTVKNDRGTVAFDQVQLGFCHITSPLTGKVGLRLVDPGNVVNTASATPLVVVTQLQPISVVFTISEDDLGAVLVETRRGARLAVTALDRAKSKELAHGSLLTVDNQIDTTTGTVKLRALFDNADEALFPNQFVNTRLLVRTIDGATTVPSSAVQHDGNQAFLYMIQDGHARLRKIVTGIVEADRTQVDGIAPGTAVVNSSFDKLQDGVAVTIDSPRAISSAPGARSSQP